MFNVLSEINWLAVLAGSIAMTVLGGIWFMGLFRKQYPIALGRTDLGDQKPSPLFIAGPFVCGAIVVLTDAILIRALGIGTYGDALVFGTITGIGYLTAQTVNIAINPNFPRPFFYSLINGPYFLFGNLIVCAILVAMA